MNNTLIADRIRPYPHFKFPDEISISYNLMTDLDCTWYNCRLNSYRIKVDHHGWFPCEVLMGVINGKYCDTHNIGAVISGTMGSACIAVVDIEKAIKLLNDAGYLNVNKK